MTMTQGIWTGALLLWGVLLVGAVWEWWDAPDVRPWLQQSAERDAWGAVYERQGLASKNGHFSKDGRY